MRFCCLARSTLVARRYGDVGQHMGVVGRRSQRPARPCLIGRLVGLVAACAKCGPVQFVTDGLVTYIDAVRKAFCTHQGSTGGRPRLVGWPELAIAQVVKQYAGRAVTGTLQRLVHGIVEVFLTKLWSTPGCQVLNTAYIEGLNGTFRSRLAVLGRRTRCAARRAATFAHGMYLVGTVYNYCSMHSPLTREDGRCQTPAMARGITDHVWTVGELGATAALGAAATAQASLTGTPSPD
jgi:hypothetical protein